MDGEIKRLKHGRIVGQKNGRRVGDWVEIRGLERCRDEKIVR